MLFNICIQIALSIFAIAKVDALIVPQIDLVTSGGRADYVRPGESFRLSCVYLPEKDETLKLIQWDLDGQVVYVHKHSEPQPRASGVLTDRVNPATRLINTFEVLNATVAMSGNYTCHAYSDLHSEPAVVSRQLFVIVDSCGEDSWQTRSDMINCREQITFACSGVYPRPQPSCAIYDEYTGNVLQSELVERIEQTETHAFDLSLFRQYRAENYRSLQVPLSFRCRLKVDYTGWTKSFTHHLFAESGCLLAKPNQTLTRFTSLDSTSPLRPIGQSRLILHTDQIELLHGEPACLVGVREGAVAKFHCGQPEAANVPLLVCLNRTWIYIQDSQRQIVIDKLNNKIKLNFSEILLDSQKTVVCGNALRIQLSIVALVFYLTFSFWLKLV